MVTVALSLLLKIDRLESLPIQLDLVEREDHRNPNDEVRVEKGNQKNILVQGSLIPKPGRGGKARAGWWVAL